MATPWSPAAHAVGASSSAQMHRRSSVGSPCSADLPKISQLHNHTYHNANARAPTPSSTRVANFKLISRATCADASVAHYRARTPCDRTLRTSLREEKTMARLIQRVSISNFRSIRELDLKPLDEYLPLVGLNSSGKSNLLRALSLLFTDSIDETRAALDLSRDYSGYAPRGKKREISVGVELNLTGDFRITRLADFAKQHGIVSTIGIRRTWFLETGAQTPTSRVEFGPSLDDLREAESRAEESNALTYLRAIDFRYMPNHTRPYDLMLREIAPIRRALMQRLQGTKEYRDASPESVMQALSRTAGRMFDDVSNSVRQGIPGLSVQPTLPKNFADLAFELLIAAVSGDTNSRTPDLEGSGAQSFMLLHFLELADRSLRGQGFGWTQGSIWALEEPESFLHSGLRYKYADDLRKYAEDSRRQVFLTTHMDEFVAVGRNAVVFSVEPTRSAGSRASIESAREAIRFSTRQAISVYRHPLARWPESPLVIVEGNSDAKYLELALIQAQLRPRWRMVSAEDLDAKSGGDNILSFLKANAAAISARPATGPIIVLRDWEDENAPNRYRDALKGHPVSRCIVAPVDLANPDLGEKFVGIERYLPTTVINSVIPPRHLSRSLDGGALQVDRKALESKKKELVGKVLTDGDPGQHMVALATWLDSEVVTALTTVPPEEFVRVE